MWGEGEPAITKFLELPQVSNPYLALRYISILVMFTVNRFFQSNSIERIWTIEIYFEYIYINKRHAMNFHISNIKLTLSLKRHKWIELIDFCAAHDRIPELSAPTTTPR